MRCSKARSILFFGSVRACSWWRRHRCRGRRHHEDPEVPVVLDGTSTAPRDGESRRELRTAIEHRAVQQARSVDDSEDEDSAAGDPEDCSVVAVDEMPVARPQQLVFRSHRPALGEAPQCDQLALQLVHEAVGCVTIALRDETPDVLDIILGGSSDLNEVLCGHV